MVDVKVDDKPIFGYLLIHLNAGVTNNNTKSLIGISNG